MGGHNAVGANVLPKVNRVLAPLTTRDTAAGQAHGTKVRYEHTDSSVNNNMEEIEKTHGYLTCNIV